MKKYITATVYESAVRHNLSLLREHIGSEVKLYPVVKSDCYGHGLELLLDIISEYADGLCVATPASAMRLRHLGYDGELLSFFSACSYSENIRKLSVAELVSADITQTIVDIEEAKLINEVAGRLIRGKAKVHLKIDSGMNRSGIPIADTVAMVDFINKCDGLILEGIYSHFASADEEDLSVTERQLGLFKDIISKCDISNDVMLHIANSAATIRMPLAHLNMVRPGLAVYGYHSSVCSEDLLPLRPCLRVTAPLIQIKDVAMGSSCGYGLTFSFKRDSRIGRIPVGYGDGYPRSLSNKAVVRIKGIEAPVCGRVSMDQLIVDLADVPDISVGDEVEIISDDSAAPNSVGSLARLAGSIPYEITCGLRSERICRKVERR